MDAEIDLLCQRTISLLEAWWDGVFTLMRVQSPSQTEKEQAKEMIENAMRLHRELCLSVSPTAHTMEDHAWQQASVFHSWPCAFN